MILTDVRVDWVFLAEPGQNGKYGVCALIPKGSKQEADIKGAIDTAIKKAIDAGKLSPAHVKSPSFKQGLRDGDLEHETDERPAHYKGHWFFNAYNASQPGMVDEHAKPLMDASKIYSGCYCHLDIGVYAYVHPKGGKGVGFAVNNVMFVRDGERLDGRQSAEDAFASLAVASEDDGELK